MQAKDGEESSVITSNQSTGRSTRETEMGAQGDGVKYCAPLDEGVQGRAGAGIPMVPWQAEVQQRPRLCV